MARVSKNELDQVILEQITDQLQKTVTKLSDRDTDYFINAFFGKEERVMFAKRLAIIIMIHEGASGYEISNALKVSQATVGKIVERYDRGDYKQILTQIKKEKVNYGEFLDLIDTILTLGLPRYNSKDRWRILR